MSRSLADALRWVDEGNARVRDALVGVGEDEAAWQSPSALPDWSVKHLVAHVAGNAEALRNLVTWARTGVETPMYSSTEQRNADIEAGAQRPAHDLRVWFETSAEALATGWADLSGDQWDAPVRTAQGRTVPVSETPWMRARELMVHAVDVGSGVRFADLDDEFLVALVDDIVARRDTEGGPALLLAPDDRDERWEVIGEGDRVTVVGPISELAAWLAGRPASDLAADGGELPALSRWL